METCTDPLFDEVQASVCPGKLGLHDNHTTTPSLAWGAADPVAAGLLGHVERGIGFA